jgi:putative oxidoreductase
VSATTYQRLAYTLLRIVAPFIMMQHGAQKLFGAFGGFGPNGGTAPLVSLMGLAGVLEVFVAALVLLGLFTRPAAFILAGEMATAYFMAHFPRGFWPIQNHGETPVLLCFIYVMFAAFGGGQYSLDALLFRSQRTASAEDLVRSV